MDRFDAMTILVATVETGSFSAAGRKLGIPLAAVSRKVAGLEAYLKLRPLALSTRKLTPTDSTTARRPVALMLVAVDGGITPGLWRHDP
jgi:DNA-binding transcriptional LysR family regulator